MITLDGEITEVKNIAASPKQQLYPDHLKHILDIKDVKDVKSHIHAWPGYAKTPLHSLEDIAEKCGIDKIWYKDESSRFNLGSFKALGGAYAVGKQLIAELKKRFSISATLDDLLANKYKKEISQLCVSCATDGNHGRSVAWGAQLFGCQCVIYIHKSVSKGREEAIAQYGALVIRIEGNYDDSVRIAAQDASKHHRIIISDTSYPGYMEIPKDVSMGYTVMLDECIEQLNDDIPTHIFIQGGVGGLASSVCAYVWQKWQEQRPTFIVVEPVNANCLQQSAINGELTVVKGDLETLMAGLACGEVSVLAWDILSIGADYFITVSEDTIAPTMKLLAQYDIQAGESAVAGLSACILAAKHKILGIDKHAKVLLIGTEGATDPKLYEQLTGITVGS